MSSMLKKIGEIFRIISLWLFEDVIFAVMPILVIVSITVFLNQSFVGFLSIKEWSFATIVFFGVAIRRLIRLKVRLQLTPYSYKLDAGVQFYIVLLIAAVLVLSLVILVEKNIITNINTHILASAQILLFSIGALTILVSVIAETDAYDWINTKLDKISKSWYLQRIDHEADFAEDCLLQLRIAIKRIPSFDIAIKDNEGSLEYEEEKLFSKINMSVERMITLSEEIKKQLQVCGPKKQ